MYIVKQIRHMANAKCLETLGWYSQQQSPYAFAIYNIFTEKSKWHHSTNSICFITPDDLLYPTVHWTQEEWRTILLFPVQIQTAVSYVTQSITADVLYCWDITQKLEPKRNWTEMVVAFGCVLVIYNGLLGLALFRLSEGLLTDMEAHTQAARSKDERNCRHNVAWML